MPISAGRPLLLPPYDCVYTPTANSVSPSGYADPRPAVVIPPASTPFLIVQDFPDYTYTPRFSSSGHWVAELALTRPRAFANRQATGRLLQLNRELPVVGNLRACLEVLGLRGSRVGVHVGDDFADVPRGARKYTTASGQYIVWEPRNYFGKPRTLLRTPKVVLISVDERRLPVFNYDIPTGLIRLNSDVADAIDLRYDDLIDARGLTVILDVTANVSYNPYSYGVPLDPHNGPHASSPALDQFLGGELLVIHINPFDVELMPNGSIPNYATTVFPVQASYFRYIPGQSYIVQVLTFFPPSDIHYLIDQPGDLVNFADPTADGGAWTAAEGNYSRRRHIIHNAVFPASPYSTWGLFEDLKPSPFVYTTGPAPHGHGVNYIANTKPAGMLIGRPYQRESGGSFISTDFTAAIIEDIEDFYA